jgi:hypothetical protein
VSGTTFATGTSFVLGTTTFVAGLRRGTCGIADALYRSRVLP